MCKVTHREITLEDLRACILLFAEDGLEILQQTSRLEFIDIDKNITDVMHIRAIYINLPCPLLYKTPLAVDVVAVVVFHRLLPNRSAIITRDVKHGLNHCGQNIFWINGKQSDTLTIIHRDARVGCPKVNANFDGHGFIFFHASAEITPMDRTKPPASIEPAPVIVSAK